jgi:hypothetical protein
VPKTDSSILERKWELLGEERGGYFREREQYVKGINV